MNLPNKYYSVNVYKRSKLVSSFDFGSFYKVLNIINKFDSLEKSQSKVATEGEARICVNGVSSSDFNFVHSFRVDNIEEFERALCAEKVRL